MTGRVVAILERGLILKLASFNLILRATGSWGRSSCQGGRGWEVWARDGKNNDSHAGERDRAPAEVRDRDEGGAGGGWGIGSGKAHSSSQLAGFQER